MFSMRQTVYQQKNDIAVDRNYSDDCPVSITYKKLHKNHVFIDGKADTQPHWHEFIEIEFISEGIGIHTINNNEYSLERGSVYIVKPSDFHCLNCYPEDWLHIWNVGFDISVISPDIAELISSSKDFLQTKLSAELSEKIEKEFLDCKKAFDEEKDLSPLIIKNQIEKIVLIIIKDIAENNRYKTKTVNNSVPPIIQETINYIQIHFREKIPLYETAKALHISTNYLGEIFAKEMGMSYNDYVNSIRLKYSKSLLKKTDYSISQICYASGFSTVSYFSKLFFTSYGLLPSEYRLKKQQENKN